jgi:Predicted kinase
MNKNIILNIQKEFIENANTKYSLNYLNDYILPIIEYIVFSNKKKFLIGGSQGIGKSTLVKIINKIIQTFYNKKVLILCLDDYYLTKKKRGFLAKNVHPLLINKGVPGTHDIVKLLRDIKKFEDNNYPIKIPIFDKLIDDRLRKKRVEILKSDILILEGWCCGAEHLKNNYLFKNINQLQKNKDVNFIWRKFYNNKLKNEYQNLFKII